MVDEFQDASHRQFQLVDMLSEKSGNLFVVGDPDQSIYLFRKAEPTLFNNLDEYIPNLKTIFMTKNYRSSDEIVKVSNEVIKMNIFRCHNTNFRHKFYIIFSCNLLISKNQVFCLII